MNARVSLDTLVEWFKEADKSHLMSKDELKAYHELPDELRIYRGIGEKSNPNPEIFESMLIRNDFIMLKCYYLDGVENGFFY